MEEEEGNWIRVIRKIREEEMVSKDQAFKHGSGGDLLPGLRSNETVYIINLSKHMQVKRVQKYFAELDSILCSAENSQLFLTSLAPFRKCSVLCFSPTFVLLKYYPLPHWQLFPALSCLVHRTAFRASGSFRLPGYMSLGGNLARNFRG